MKKSEEVERLADIHVLSRELQIDSAVLAGVMEFRGWKRGKTVSEKEFDSALADFLRAKAG